MSMLLDHEMFEPRTSRDPIPVDVAMRFEVTQLGEVQRPESGVSAQLETPQLGIHAEPRQVPDLGVLAAEYLPEISKRQRAERAWTTELGECVDLSLVARDLGIRQWRSMSEAELMQRDRGRRVDHIACELS
jgi:hypothetical protein